MRDARFRAQNLAGPLRRRPSVRERVRPKVTSLARLCDRYVDSRFAPPSRRRCRRCPSSPPTCTGRGTGRWSSCSSGSGRGGAPSRRTRRTWCAPPSSERLQAARRRPGHRRASSPAPRGASTPRSPARPGSAPATDSPLRTVAYFSPEFGLTEALPQYSGGLGVLAGDHLKASSDLGVPLVGVGLLYAEGYFRQQLDADGWQEERTPEHRPRVARARRPPACRSPSTSPATPSRSHGCGRPTSGGSRCTCSTPTVDGNSPEASPSPTGSTAATTSTGSARRSSSASAACGRCGRSASNPQVFHTNEGHAGFLGLERIREHVASRPVVRRGGRGGARRRRVHHPHAGPGRHRPFPRRLMEKYFASLRRRVRRRRSTSCSRSAARPDEPDGRPSVQHGGDGPAPGRPRRTASPSCTARSAARCSTGCGRTSRRRGADRLDHQRRPRPHAGSSTRVDELLSRARRRRLGDGADATRWSARPRPRPGRGVGHAGAPGARGLVRVRAQPARRRRARPGRAHDRLRPPVRHVQAGDAAAVAARAAARAAARRRPAGAVRVRRQGPPRRQAGQGADPARSSSSPASPTCGHRFVFLPDYDMAIARDDVPRLRRVAEQAAPPARGVRHERDEGRAQRRAQLLDPRRLVGRVATTAGNGWAIESAEDDPDLERRDQREAASLFALLEQRDRAAVLRPQPPTACRAGGCEMVLQAWATLGPKVTAARMVRDYTTELYEPAARQSRSMNGKSDGGRRRAGSVARQRPRGVVVGAHHLARRRHQPGRHRGDAVGGRHRRARRR